MMYLEYVLFRDSKPGFIKLSAFERKVSANCAVLFDDMNL